MSILNNIKNKLNDFQEQINASFASDELRSIRIEICNSCPELFALTNQCKKCGCFVKHKTKLVSQECPLGKW